MPYTLISPPVRRLFKENFFPKTLRISHAKLSLGQKSADESFDAKFGFRISHSIHPFSESRLAALFNSPVHIKLYTEARGAFRRCVYWFSAHTAEHRRAPCLLRPHSMQRNASKQGVKLVHPHPTFVCGWEKLSHYSHGKAKIRPAGPENFISSARRFKLKLVTERVIFQQKNVTGRDGAY
jgi:hypothetical protein